MKYKQISMFLALLLIATLIFSSCSQSSNSPGSSGTKPEETTQSGSTSGDGKEADADNKSGVAPGALSPTLDQLGPDADVKAAHGLPIAPEGKVIPLTIFQALTSTVDDLENNKFTQLILDNCGIDLEFVTAPAADAVTKRNLLLSSGDYPEIISSRGMAQNEMALYADQGIFIPLDDLIEVYAPNTKKVWEEYPESKIICTGTDGKVYSLPDINDCYHCRRGEGRDWYYRPWLETLRDGKMPQTSEEFKEYLTAIKTQDPNGNGKQDEVPLAFSKSDINRATNFFMNMFMPYPNKGYRNDDGKIVAAFTTDEFKQGLKYMNELYNEGLILEESFSIESADLIKIGENPGDPLLGNIISWGPEGGVKKSGDTKRWFEYFVLSPVEGPNGDRWAVQTGRWNAVMPGYFITDKCKNPEAAVRLGDLLLSQYYGYSAYIGPEGLSWTYASDGDISLGGGQAMFKELVAYGTQEKNCSWDQTNITNRTAEFRLTQYAEGADIIYKYLDGDFSLRDQAAGFGSYNEIMKYYACQKNLEPYLLDDKYIVPPLLYSSEANAEVADITAVINPFIEQKVAAFVTGTEDVSDGFDQFVEDLNGMGLEILLGHMQTAYDKMNAK